MSTYQKGLVELKGAWKLPLQLMHTVQPLQEDGAALVQVLRVVPMTTAVCKLMTKVQPFCLHQNLEALNTHISFSLLGNQKNLVQLCLSVELYIFNVNTLPKYAFQSAVI